MGNDSSFQADHDVPTSGSMRPRQLSFVVLTALGVVYGDIGTSPLYALRECFLGPGDGDRVSVTAENVIGVLSLIIWSLVLVISIKYLGFILRADNEGEGGILALKSLVTRTLSPVGHLRAAVVGVGLFGAALLYGDGMITPAISVLSAVEGLKVATPVFEPFVIPISLVILTSLFCIQHRGTAKVGAVFGPLMVIWFIVLAVLGLRHIVHAPAVLWAFAPWYGAKFFIANGWRGFAVLGTVFLVVTGGEALYADMGHFGRLPIRLGWFILVLPCLLLNYLGQGAMLLVSPTAINDIFYHMAPQWALYPLVILATFATIIASQAIISGAFSLTHQAVEFGYCPRMEIRHTSSEEMGQVYVPVVNWLLFLGTVGLVIGFRRSGNLAHAYGVAVTTTMLITTLLTYLVARRRWGWGLGAAIVMTAGFLVIDIAFFGSNVTKVWSGGWFPLLAAAIVFMLMATWRWGRTRLLALILRRTLPLKRFLVDVERTKPVRVPGIAVYMTGNPEGIPWVLLLNYRHNKILHEQVILLTINTLSVPYVPRKAQILIEELGQGLFRATVDHGFSQQVDVVDALAHFESDLVDFKSTPVTFFLGKESLLPSDSPVSPFGRFRRWLFLLMARNSRDAGKFFGIPPHQAVELGVQLEI